MIRIYATTEEIGSLVRQCAKISEAGQCFFCALRDACLASSRSDPPELPRVERLCVPENPLISVTVTKPETDAVSRVVLKRRKECTGL